MSLRRRLILSAIIIAVVPALLMIFLSILLAVLFVIFNPQAQTALTGSISLSDTYVTKYIIIWCVMAFLSVGVTGACVAISWCKSVLLPLKRLSIATEHIKNGDLSYEAAGSGDEELKKIFEDFEGLRLRLQKNVRHGIESDNLRQTLLVNLSHDIKTPVTSIKGYIEGIKDGVASTDEMRDRYLNTIYRKADLIERLADNLSVYSKLEMGKMQYSMKKTDITGFAERISEEFEIDLSMSDINLSKEFTKKPVYCNIDEESMRRVFSNIIINAIKYKNPGRGSLNISVKADEESIRIMFADRGLGIPREELKDIFGEFFRGDKSRNGAIPGNGLGLSVCKRIIEDHGGKIWAKNRNGGGSEFIIILPRVKDDCVS